MFSKGKRIRMDEVPMEYWSMNDDQDAEAGPSGQRMTRLRARGGVPTRPPIIDEDDEDLFMTNRRRKLPKPVKEKIEREPKEPRAPRAPREPKHQEPALAEILCKIAHRMPWEEWGDLTEAEYDVLDSSTGPQIVEIAYQKSLPFQRLLKNADELVDKHNESVQRSVLKTLKDLKRDLLSDLPRREKTPPPDPVEIERRLLQETIDEVAGLGPATEENELIEEPMIDVYEEAKRRGIQLPEHLAQPYPAQQSLLDPSMHRENGVNSFDQNLLNVGPAAGSVENSVELPEATVDEIADMGHFAGVGGLKLFNTMVARERISNNEIRESVRQRQAAKPLQLVSNPLVILENSLALDLDASMPNLADPQTLAAPRETLIGSAVQLPDLPEVQMVDQEPLPTPTNTIAEVLVPAAQEKQKKRRRKPRKQRSPSPEEYVEFPELHRELIRHKHKPRKMRQNQPQVRALAYPMIDIFDGIKDYGLDCAYLSSDDDSPILQTPGPAPEVPEAADIPEFMIPDEEPQMIQVQASTPPLETDSPQEDHASKRPRFDTIASILSPNASLIPGIRDISSLKPNGKRFTTDDIAYSYLNEKSQQALMTSEEKAMTRDELLLHKVRQAEKQELAKKAASSGASKAAEPGPEVLYQKFQGKGETMVRFVGLNGKIEKLPEYAIETVSVYLQIRMFMAKNQWRMEWDNIWENFEIPEKVTTKKMLEMRLYYLNDKGLIFLHLDDDGAILEVEIKVKPKTAEEKRAKQAQKN